jgi:aspartate/methionine/tyrosine aminotransferase
MDLPPFLLNQWLESHHGLPYNLAGSTGPRWTLCELLELGEGPPDLGALTLGYSPPEGLTELRAEIARHHGVDPDWVIVTNGASEALLLVLSALARAGGNVVLPSPGYPAFAGTAMAAHLRPRPYRLDRQRGFRLDAGAILSGTDDDTVLVVANSPHNPTGAVVPRGEAAALAAALGEKGVPLLVDEVFHPIYFGEPGQSAATIENTIVVGDLSKALAMPGLRIGWVIDRDSGRRAQMLNARSYLSLGSSPILEMLALHALRSRDIVLRRTTSVATANLASLTSFMGEMDDVLGWVPPQAGLLAFPWFRDGRDSRPFCERMVGKGVFLSPGDCFAMPDHFRIGFGSQAGGIDAALDLVGRELRP